MRKKRLSAEQAFAVMAIFLEKYYERGPANGDLAILLGDLQLNDQADYLSIRRFGTIGLPQ
jgi:hypothetical protein